MDAVVADKLTQLITDALTQAAADPGGMPLYASKSEPGLFPPTTAAKSAAKRCLDDGLLQVLRSETKGKQAREVCGITDAGLQFLIDRVSPKQVLDDFVRVLEARQSQADELLATARRMVDGLIGLRTAVNAILPRIVDTRIPIPANPERLRQGDTPDPIADTPASPNHRVAYMNGTATLAASPRTDADELAGAVLTHLADWAASAGAGQDCPLPELYRALTPREAPPTIGEFHDCLRRLHASRQIYLHPWTGPLYTLPEPHYALLVGHEVAYYASPRS
jgi:hypothetical protein